MRADAPGMAVQPNEPGSHIAAVAERMRAARIRRAGSCCEPSKFERSFDKGVMGERRLGARLDELAAESGFLVAHSLQRADGGDIDHLVVGPRGVTVIDSKCWSGTV